MAYDSKFNNTLAIWTAFGGRGNVIFGIPTLTWSKKNYSYFGYTQYGSETQINVYDNGSAQIAVYYAKTPYMSYWNKTTKQWTVVSSPYWSYGAPVILWSGGGVFLAKISGMANIIASFDGITWHNAGYCAGASNAMTCGAYDISRNSGVVSWWYYKSPIYYSFDVLTERTAWTLAGSDGISIPIYKFITTHKGNFIAIEGGEEFIDVASTATPGIWTTTIPKDDQGSRYMFVRSINDILFVFKFNYTNIGGNYTYYVKLCVLNDDATQITETNLSWTGDLANNNVPNPKNIIWMEEWRKFILLKENSMCYSNDGYTWEEVEQPGLTASTYDTFDGAIYVPGDGFYVKASGYVYYAPYQ